MEERCEKRGWRMVRSRGRTLHPEVACLMEAAQPICVVIHSAISLDHLSGSVLEAEIPSGVGWCWVG